MRPKTIEEFLGQAQVVGEASAIRRLLDPAATAAGPPSVILWGPPGTGKTTLAHVVSGTAGRRFVELSAITAGVKDVRTVIHEARDQRDLHHRQTVLFLDEIHRFTKAQQDALLPGVENRWVILIAATTENPSFSVIAPLLSRSVLLTLTSLSEDHLRTLVTRAVSDPRGLDGQVSLDPEALDALVRLSGGDARRALTALETAAGAVWSASEPVVTLPVLEQALNAAVVRYDKDGDQHYDVASALIKSVRGSDVDAALHYLARMVVAGEDPRFIARRLMISASEDIGMADPSALQTAVAAAQAVALVGMPEAQIILAQAVVHLALAPKSNASYQAIGAAVADVKAGLAGPVPVHLRDAHYAGAQRLGHGSGYQYAHDDPRGVVTQQYAPDAVAGRRYYHPTDRGQEREWGAIWRRLRQVLSGE